MQTYTGKGLELTIFGLFSDRSALRELRAILSKE